MGDRPKSEVVILAAAQAKMDSMTSPDERQPVTAAGRTARDLLIGLFRAWEEVAAAKSIEVEALHEDPSGLIRAIEVEAGEAAIRDMLAKGYSREASPPASGDALPYCQLCGSAPANAEHAVETQRRWNALTNSPLAPPLPEGLDANTRAEIGQWLDVLVERRIADDSVIAELQRRLQPDSREGG